MTSPDEFPEALRGDTGGQTTTILAYGSLLSEQSARLTFPELTRFRLVRVRGLRRVFAHPHLFLLGRGLIRPSDPNLRLASLSAEEIEITSDFTSPAEEAVGFVAAAFDVHLDDTQRAAFVERERTYCIAKVPYYDIDSDYVALPKGRGVICLAGSDGGVLSSILEPVISQLKDAGRSVWHWERDSGLLPADIYLRHCLLAVKKAGRVAEASFLEETFLADRRTSLAAYLERDDNMKRVMMAVPPEDLMERFNG